MSQTSSFRISEELHSRLKAFALLMNRNKNWVILQAIQEYLDRHDQELIAAEARRQSLLANAAAHADDEAWFELADEDGWK